MGRDLRCAGVDGCRGGWVVVTSSSEMCVVARFADVLDLVDGVVAVDMPIGLPAAQTPRPCDQAVRKVLGPRRSSVFPAPSRTALEAPTFADVRGLSIQAWNLVPKVREVDVAWTPRVVEVSPELSFTAMAGAPMARPKRTVAGHHERLVAIGLDAVPRLTGAAPDDVVDALACLWTAERVASGAALIYGDGAVDDLGRPMLVYA